jgi:outer membrane protein TolC
MSPRQAHAGLFGLLALLAGLVPALPGAAQDGPASLSLDEAIRRAQASNPAYRQDVNSLELNAIESREFWLSFLPQPQLQLLSTNMQWNRTAVSQDIFGDPVANPDFRMVQSASSVQRAALLFQLDFQDLLARRADRIRAENRVREVGDQGRELALEIRLDFLNAQEMLESRALEEALLEVRRENLELTEMRFRIAQADRADLLEAELDLVNQENDLERSRASLRSALLQLRNRIGDPTLGEIELEPAPLRLFDPEPLDEEALVEEALAGAPRIRQAQYTLIDREGAVPLQRAQWLPTLSIAASTDRQQFSRESGDGFLQPLPDADWSRRISLTLSFPDLGTWFNRQTTARRSDLEIRNAEEALRATRFSVEEEVRTLLVELESQYRTLRLQERRTELAAERLELQQEHYRLGQVDYDQVQGSAEAAANAQRQLLQARYAFERALIQLERALGAPVSP